MFERWNIPERILRDTEAAFRKAEHEVFVLWTSRLDLRDGVCEVGRCLVPDQQPGHNGFGVYVHVAGSELSRIQYENFDLGERSVVQLHTHPSNDVEMSDLDREWEVVCHVGGLSVIVPNYGKRGLIGFPGVAVYERETMGWRRWSEAERDNRLKAIP